MTSTRTDAETFAQEMLDGFAAVHRARVQRVDGGVLRRGGTPAGQVAVVIGGGSGHYPAFAGLVGDGMADAAVCGNVFASPAAGQIFRIAAHADTGAGVLLSYGNYAGDVLHFGQAEQRLRAAGIDVRSVLVTDDIASASSAEAHRRRGVAGDLFVFKVAGAAAAEGRSLDEVERLARLANDRTRSLGVAFDGCILPGQTEPLFSVPAGRMAVGLGIHGEPGTGERAVPTPAELADLLVSGLLTEAPADASGGRVAVLLNGLGTVKHEELFVIFSAVQQRLDAAGLTIVEPECGELVTSLDMAGLSLTLCWLTDELETLWRAPADAPAFRRTAMPDEPAADLDFGPALAAATYREPEGSEALAGILLAALEAAQERLVADEDELGRLDAVAGDGDHGVGMTRGSTAALAAAREVAEREGGAVELLSEAGTAWSERAGGTSGALWGAALTAAAAALADAGRIDAAAGADAVAAALSSVQRLGGAQVGDKTLVDSLAPFAATLTAAVASGELFAPSWLRAAQVAADAAAATAGLTPRLGRARPLAAKSVGWPDAGAISLSRVALAAAETLTARADLGGLR